MSKNDEVCFDTVLHAVAARSVALPEPGSAGPLLAGALLALALARRN